MRATRTLAAIAAVVALAGGMAACGDDGDGDEGAAAATAATTVEVVLDEQNGSRLSGTALLADAGAGRTRVTVSLDGRDAGPARPAHVHEGTCAQLDPAPAYGLRNVEDGASETVIDASVDALRDGTFAINLHRSVDDLETYVACGDIG